MGLKMKTIKKPKEGTRSVIVSKDLPPPLIEGQGILDYDCGSCGVTLMTKVAYKQVKDVAVKCPNCDAYNEIPRSHHTH